MQTGWNKPEGFPRLLEGEVQVWRLDLSVQPIASGRADFHPSDLLDGAYALLNDRELQRAGRMRAGPPREEFIAGRGCLRLLLGSALDCDPRKIGLSFGAHGKPEVVREGSPTGVVTAAPAFNVAHSRGMILIAMTRAGALGVDVEYLDPNVEANDVARASLHRADAERIRLAASDAAGIADFYACWTRQEAIAKADGRGLTLPAVEWTAKSEADREQVVSLPADREGEAARLYVRGIEVDSRYAAALACERPRLRMIRLEFDVAHFLNQPNGAAGRSGDARPRTTE